MRNQRPILLIAVCLLALAFVSTGCGGDDDETTTTATEEAGATGATGEEGATEDASAFEQGLRKAVEDSDSVTNFDFTCDEDIPPAEGSVVTCEATGESDEGEPAEGTLELSRGSGDDVDFTVELTTEAGGIISVGATIGVDGESSSLSL